MEIKDKKESENVVAGHLSHLEADKGTDDPTKIEEFFPNELLVVIEASLSWYADIVNFLAYNVLPPYFDSRQRKKLLHDLKCYQVI